MFDDQRFTTHSLFVNKYNLIFRNVQINLNKCLQPNTQVSKVFFLLFVDNEIMQTNEKT